MNYDDQTLSPEPDAPARSSLPVFSLVCLAITVGFVLGMAVSRCAAMRAPAPRTETNR